MGEEGGVRGWVQRHPLLVVAVLSSLVAIGHGIWIWNNRHLGAIDPDEAGYVATAFRYERLLLDEPLALPRAIGGTGNGPLVPLLTVPLLLIGPHDVRTALLMQPILMVITAVSVAGIARRLAGPGAAIVSGLALVTLPTMIFAAQTYWLGLGAAFGMAAAMWALLESDRLTNRWTYGYGLGVAAMLLSRTMTLGFLPAALVAGVVIAGRRRDSWLGLLRAVVTAVLVAGPWYRVARKAIFGYLFSYGYGERAGLFGQGGLPARFAKRLSAFDFGGGFASTVAVWTLVLAAGWAGWTLWRRRGEEGWPAGSRGALAVGLALAAGFSALLSTTNNGVWFELPLVAIAVPLVVSLAARLPLPVRAAAVGTVVLAGAMQLSVSWWLVEPGRRQVFLVDERNRPAQYEYGFGEYDLRFLPDRRDELEEAAAEWYSVNSRLERAMARLTPDRMTVFTQSGNFQLLNSNSVQLVGELRGWTPRIAVPDTVLPRAERRADLTPRTRSGTREAERIVVVALHRQILFTPDEKVRSFYEQALDLGWEVTESIPIPGGGVVHILRHPDGA